MIDECLHKLIKSSRLSETVYSTRTLEQYIIK